MTCKDCLHYDVCPKPYYGDIICCNDIEERCENFKNKSDYVEVVRCGKLTLDKFNASYNAWKNHISHGNCYKLGKEMDRIISSIIKNEGD